MRTGGLKTGARMKIPVMEIDHMLPTNEKGKLDIDRAQGAVDEQVQGSELELTEALRQRGPTVLWKLLSQAAEKGVLSLLGDPMGRKAAAGRGEHRSQATRLLAVRPSVCTTQSSTKIPWLRGAGVLQSAAPAFT